MHRRIESPFQRERFLDKKFLHRIGRRAPAGLDTYNPVTVDGRWVQHPTILYGQFQKAINWTTEDMIKKVCGAAQAQKAGPAGPSLSEVLGSSAALPEATTTKKGGSTFDTLNGNVLSR